MVTLARQLCPERYYQTPLLAVAAYALPSGTRTLPDRPIDEQRWPEVLRVARTHRLTGELLAAVHDQALPVTPAQARQAQAIHRSALVRVLHLEQALVAMVEQLSAEDIEVRVLKGPAVAKLDYQRPELRSFIDVDILVHPARIDRAVRYLVSSGFQRTLAEPRTGFDRQFDKGVTLRSTSGYELDLHRTFVLGPWGMRVAIEDLWDGGTGFEIGRRRMRALSGINRFLHACYHAALGNWPLRLGSLRDVAEMLPTAEREHHAVLQRASDWGVEAIVASAIHDTTRLLGLDVAGDLVAWAKRYVPTARDEAWLALHTHAGKTFTAQALATVPTIPGLADKLRYLRALALPDSAYTRGRHSSMAGRFRYGVREARRGKWSQD